MGQGLSKKVLKRHVVEAMRMETILQNFFKDMSIRLIVLTTRLTHSPYEVAADFSGSVKYLMIYNPLKVEANIDSDDDTRLNDNDDDSFSHQLTKKILKCKDFISLRRLCYEYEGIMELAAQTLAVQQRPETVTLKAGEKRSVSYDPDECSICMDSAIDIVLPCLHGYCSACWEDWSSHSSTCPHCRGEVKDTNTSQVVPTEGGAPGLPGSGGGDDIWQFESWGEADTQKQLAEIEATLRCFVSQLPMNFSADVMASHRILNGDPLPSGGGGGGGGAMSGR